MFWLIELIIFAAITFFILHKLFSILGTDAGLSYEEKQRKNKKTDNSKDNKESDKVIFGEFVDAKIENIKPDIKKICVKENENEILAGLNQILTDTNNFDINKFLDVSKKVLLFTLESIKNDKIDALEGEIIDASYFYNFQKLAEKYKVFDLNNIKNNDVSYLISDAYIFGSNAFIKIIFSVKAGVFSEKKFEEEWGFCKNIDSQKPNWFVNNILEV